MKILIIGGTGTLGSTLTEHYALRGHQVTVFSRDPHKQIALGRIVPSANFVLGDITRDFDQLAEACEDQARVIHAAALKHVHLGESHVSEFVRVNIEGALSVAKACRRAGVADVLFISSDKAVDPINLYGRTKAVGEDIFTQFGYSALRYGNVINSRGNVLEIWREVLRRNGRITLRTPYPTRFYMTVQIAVDMIDEVFESYENAVFVPRYLKAFSVANLAASLGIQYHEIQYESLQPGEKQHEALLSAHERAWDRTAMLATVEKIGHATNRSGYTSDTAPQMTIDELHAEVYGYWTETLESGRVAE